MHIALLEDDPSQAEFIQSVLVAAGHQCALFSAGRPLMAELARDHAYDMLLLDWEVPDISGLDVLRWARDNFGQSLPIIFVTSRTAEEDLVVGLQAGADDYIMKPLRQGELVARIAALQRRLVPVAQSDDAFVIAAYEVDPARGTVCLRGQAIELAPKEFELAVLFFRNPGRLFSRDVLSNTVWNREIPATSRTLDTHLSNIRRKLQLRPDNGVRLASSYALGYRLELLADPES